MTEREAGRILGEMHRAGMKGRNAVLMVQLFAINHATDLEGLRIPQVLYHAGIKDYGVEIAACRKLARWVRLTPETEEWLRARGW